ncbi:MAG TPA: VOC family protein [Thermomicrobiales bacterium]|nr:VOC family protein [Thermomicrobiales bacterium]
MATVHRIYPVLYSSDVAQARDFYVDHFDFEVTFESDWYASLRHRHNPAYELAIIDASHDSIPEQGRGAISRLLLNIEVGDATAEAERLRDAGVDVVQELRDEPFGQRHLIVAAPDGVLVDVIEEIAPSPEFAALFKGSQTAT